MNPVLYKNTLIKIKKSFGRYLSLLIIVMVGVGFYAGIAITAPSSIKVADNYYKSSKIMDFKIISSMGLTDDDVNAIKTIDGVNTVTPSYSLDVSSNDKAIRAHAMEDSVNTVKLTDGRMPRSNKECVAENKKYNIGDIIEITSDVTDELKQTEFMVVGLVESVLYLSEDYGTTTIGNGTLSAFFFIDKENFILDAYTEIYITAETNNSIAYSDSYKALTEKVNDELVKIKPDREDARFDGLKKDVNRKISKNENKLNEKKSDAEKKLKDGKKELDDNAIKLKDGKETALKEFKKAKATLDKNNQKLKDGKKKLIKNKADLEVNIKTQNAEFDTAKKKISDGWKKINAALTEAEMSKANIGSKIVELEAAIENMKAQLKILPADSSEYLTLQATITEYSNMLKNLKQLKTAIDTLSKQEKQLNDGMVTFRTKIRKAKRDIITGEAKLAMNEKKLQDGYEEYEDNVAKFNSKMEKNEKKLNDGYAKYYKNLEKFNTEIEDAETKISDAKADLAELKHAKWYISQRNAALGYDRIDSAFDITSSISRVFPLFFILIVMLMASNSMARMIAEERGELGTLTSLGYKDHHIIRTYLLYVLSASGIGAVIGFFIGCRVIPPLIYSNYKFMLPPLVVKYDIISLGIILAVTFVLMILVTIFSCRKELKNQPASLMRPVPPKHGQKILLERIGFLWNPLSFTWKVTMRNMFRYKKRAFMTIVGVAGCTALMLVGFGIRDSMNGVAEKQYHEILRYSNMITLKDETKEIDKGLKTLLEKEQVIDPLLIRQTAYRCEQDGKTVDAFLIVPQDNELFPKHFNLKSTIDKKKIALEDNGVVVTQMIAKTYKLQKGDTIAVKDADNNAYDLTVSDVAENYTSNYIYMNPSVYNKVFGKAVIFNTVVSDNRGDEMMLAEKLIDSDYVINVVMTSDVMGKIIENNQSINSIVVLLVVISSLLAFIVLYNLTAINISERTREIATLKVLGFRDGETNAYIYREAIILTIVSIAIGMVLGVFLHLFVIDVIESSISVFFRKIEWLSFTISGALTMLFPIIMQAITYFKLKKIDMIESLKSVE